MINDSCPFKLFFVRTGEMMDRRDSLSGIGVGQILLTPPRNNSMRIGHLKKK